MGEGPSRVRSWSRLKRYSQRSVVWREAKTASPLVACLAGLGLGFYRRAVAIGLDACVSFRAVGCEKSRIIMRTVTEITVPSPIVDCAIRQILCRRGGGGIQAHGSCFDLGCLRSCYPKSGHCKSILRSSRHHFSFFTMGNPESCRGRARPERHPRRPRYGRSRSPHSGRHA